MNDFTENKCRICKQILCCKKCRSQHEEKTHRINLECDICVYGKSWGISLVKHATATLLNHIKNKHWPMHCVKCSMVFGSIEHLLQHRECSVKEIPNLTMPTTPVTPIDNCYETSPILTPFDPKTASGSRKFELLLVMGVTSTPMQENHGLLTPYEQNKYVCKSSLKHTNSGSGILNESKRSERRVTFSETPITEIVESPKNLPMLLDKANETDSIFYSVHSEKCNEESVNTNNSDGDTLWESASNSCDWIALTPKRVERTVENKIKEKNYSTSDDDLISDDVAFVSSSEHVNKSTSIWSSVTQAVKSVVHNISITTQNRFTKTTKRRLSDDSIEKELVRFKKMKFSDIKCRRTIRDISPLYQIRIGKPTQVDKSTQTDDSLFTW